MDKSSTIWFQLKFCDWLDYSGGGGGETMKLRVRSSKRIRIGKRDSTRRFSALKKRFNDLIPSSGFAIPKSSKQIVGRNNDLL